MKGSADVYWFRPGEIEEALETFLATYEKDSGVVMKLLFYVDGEVILENTTVTVCAVPYPKHPEEITVHIPAHRRSP